MEVNWTLLERFLANYYYYYYYFIRFGLQLYSFPQKQVISGRIQQI